MRGGVKESTWLGRSSQGGRCAVYQVWEEGGMTQHPVLTRSIFIIVAEVQTNCPAEL